MPVSGFARQLFAGDALRLGEYDVHVEHGYLPVGIPGTAESVAIVCVNTCPLEPAIESARFLASKAGCELVDW